MKNPDAQIAVYPWIDLKEPIEICGVRFLPRSIALQEAGALREHIEGATSYFYDHYLVGALEFGFDELQLERLTPTIVLLDENVTVARVEIANLVWFAATVFGNQPPISYANATTFAYFVQQLGGDAKVLSRRTRRMHGSYLSGSMNSNALDVRPHWCGAYHKPDHHLLALLSEVIDRPDALYIKECLSALLLATTDDDTQPEDAEHANFARAAERLLHRPNQKMGKRNVEQAKLATSLLTPFLNGEKPFGIIEVRDAMRDQRNAFWHPEDRKNATRKFERQNVIRPNVIAFRAIMALLIASSHALVGGVLSEKLHTYVPAVENWINAIQADDARTPEDASNIGPEWSKLLFLESVRREMQNQTAAT